jgi:hypothetical protein
MGISEKSVNRKVIVWNCLQKIDLKKSKNKNYNLLKTNIQSYEIRFYNQTIC